MYALIKRWMDVGASAVALFLLMPLFLLLAIRINLGSRGGVFFGQQRVGLHGRLFMLWKFRTMRPGAESGGQLTVGTADARITREGLWLRRYKLDELPQLWNVLRGDMSLVGPRPEVPRYVEHYDPCQRKVLEVRPGLTDYASLAYINENEILGKAGDPEKTYLENIMPAKLELNMKYMAEQSLKTDLFILAKTFSAIFGRSKAVR